MSGKPLGLAFSPTPSTVSRRPLTEMLWPLTVVRPFSARRNFCMFLNEPLKSNEKGIVGKPAGPTPAPGGSALLTVLAEPAAVLPVADATAAAAPVGAGPAEPGVSLIARKSMWLALAVDSSW